MFPKDYTDLQMLTNNYQLPTWSTIKFGGYGEDGTPRVDLFIGNNRSKPVYSVAVGLEDFADATCNRVYREMKKYLDTHYLPRKPRVIDEFSAPEA